jgi:hypothetical protein
MIAPPVAIESVLNQNAILKMLVGVDANGFVKIYSSVSSRPAGEKPPFVTFQVIPGILPTGTYQSPEGLVSLDFQVTSWGRVSREAWQIHNEVQTAIEDGDWATYLIPEVFMQCRSLEFPGEIPDQDTNWRQIPRRWRLQYDRG